MKNRSEPKQNIEDLFYQKLEPLLSNANLHPEDSKLILAAIKLREFQKGEFMLREGETCQYLGILISGLLSAYYMNENGEKAVSRFFFMPNNAIVTSFDSFKYGTKSSESIVALEPSIMLIVSNKDLNVLYDKISGLDRIGRSFAEQSYLQALEKIKILQAMKAENRLSWFQKAHPGMISRLSKTDLASYLGMHRNTFNREFKKLKM